jgi:hypothetical protein
MSITTKVVSSSTSVSSTNKTDSHDIIENLLKVALNTITIATMFESWPQYIFVPYILRERPFNLKGGGRLCFSFKKNILIPNVAKKNILILEEEKK